MRLLRTTTRAASAGFTFLELMVVIAILAILVVFMIPNMSGTRDKAALRTGARQMTSAGMLARQLAIAYGEETELILHKDTGKWQLRLTPELKDKRERRRLSSGSRRAADGGRTGELAPTARDFQPTEDESKRRGRQRRGAPCILSQRRLQRTDD